MGTRVEVAKPRTLRRRDHMIHVEEGLGVGVEVGLGVGTRVEPRTRRRDHIQNYLCDNVLKEVIEVPVTHRPRPFEPLIIFDIIFVTNSLIRHLRPLFIASKLNCGDDNSHVIIQ